MNLFRQDKPTPQNFYKVTVDVPAFYMLILKALYNIQIIIFTMGNLIIWMMLYGAFNYGTPWCFPEKRHKWAFNTGTWGQNDIRYKTP